MYIDFIRNNNDDAVSFKTASKQYYAGKVYYDI